MLRRAFISLKTVIRPYIFNSVCKKDIYLLRLIRTVETCRRKKGAVCEPPGVLPIMAHSERLRPKGVPFIGLQVNERVGISLVEVYMRIEKSFISICKRT